MHCLAVQKLPEGEGWEYGLKLDSYPTLAVKHNGRLTLFSPNKKSSNARFPGITAALDKLPDKSFVDGEVVAMDDSARPSFNRLQNVSKNAHAITFYAFDLIWKDEDLRSQPLENCCELLRSKVMPTLSAIRYSDSFAVTAENMVAAVRS